MVVPAAAPRPELMSTTAKELGHRSEFSCDYPSKHSNRIEIWRREVAAATQYCECSAPTTTDATGLRAIYRRSMAKIGKHDPDDAGHVGYLASTDIADNSPHLRESVTQYCPGCALPKAGVKYKRQGKRDFGLVRARTPSPTRIPRHGHGYGYGLTQERRRRSSVLLTRAAQVFFPRNKGRDQQLPLIELVERPRKRATAATEMYSHLRLGRIGPGSVVYGDDETGSEVSEHSGKKPKTGIAASAERLNRARKLLDRRAQGRS
ncbi:hypothetical protein F5Y07DRAFT_355054 [Xylaria sp. FL0933]|nr:hypothetical protein F5Y07DRAFT_355054 [Xylaria sp. FL0933]